MCSVIDKKGFTLVELLFVIFFSSILMAAILVSVNSGLKSSSAMERKVAAQQDVGAALSIMSMEIGMASYNPTFVSNAALWSDLSSTTGGICGISTAAPTNPTWKGIVEASANSITIEGDINESGTIGASGSVLSAQDPNEVIRYVYDATNQYITRCTCCSTSTSGGGAQPFLGETNARALLGVPKGVNVINSTLNMPVFRYYDSSGTEITDLATGIPNIRKIDINLAVETEKVDDITHQKVKMYYSTSVIPRNHVIN